MWETSIAVRWKHCWARFYAERLHKSLEGDQLVDLTLKRILNGILTGAALFLILGLVIAPLVAGPVISLLGIKGQGVCMP